ncbi:HNH endonuclease [Nostoc sp. CENA543]|uniref:HNH endonuclease n=1 Tax=Nostoc sp. CENA543 TaxID=1869241 RepID=UPI000CA1A2D2|nr:HNH endonuclease signature motif containing protein [Nostoc sp. CENA543]AUT03921.1 HNH endonuclease [Nostoc sp. CENA543]
MSVYIPVELQRKIRARFTECCAYCRTAEYLTVSTFEFEHIIPLSVGGETIFENLCLSCPTCNRYKAYRQTAIDADTQQEICLFHPQQQLWSEHFAWNEDATEIIPLTSVGRVTISALKMNRPQLIRVRRMWVKLGEHPPNIP